MKNGHDKHARVNDPGPLPPSATYCRHCNQAFPVAVPILGAPPETGFVQLTAQLAEHIQRKHPQEVQGDITAQVNASIAYAAQKVLAHFDSSDQGLMEWRDRVRHMVFREMMRGSVSDEKIAEKVAALFALWESDEKSVSIEELVIQLVKSLRDAIEERNLYPEASANPPQPLISVV